MGKTFEHKMINVLVCSTFTKIKQQTSEIVRKKKNDDDDDLTRLDSFGKVFLSSSSLLDNVCTRLETRVHAK